MSNHTQKVIENLEEKVAKYESLLGPLATSEKKIEKLKEAQRGSE